METNDSATIVGATAAQARVIARLARVFETRLADEPMSLPQFRLLSFLSEGEWAASVLADRLEVSRPSVTALVDGLVERGWVERRESPDDRRRVLHQITPAGRRELSSASDRLAAALEDLFAHLDPDERARADAGLDAVADALQRHWVATRP